MFESSGAHLLLVQKEPVLAELTTFRLELLGYCVERSETGADAQAAIARALPDMVIVDTVLPDIDGIEWIKRLRGDYAPEQVPVLVFSLDPSLETVERAFQAGAQDYLITPFDPTVMEDKIETLLASRVMAARRR